MAQSAMDAMQRVREATEAAAANDPETQLAKLEAAAALRPDFPDVLAKFGLAAAAAARDETAVAALEQLATLGLALEEGHDSLRSRIEYQAVLKKFAANLRPKGKGEIAFTLRGVTGLIEGIAWREKTGEFFFGDVHHRAVWIRGKDETLRRFSPEGDELLGVFGLCLDEENGSLWVATAAVPEMRGYAPEHEGTATLAQLDLASGQVRQAWPVPGAGASRPSGLRAIARAPEGDLWVTDRAGSKVWRLAAGGTALEPALAGGELIAPQGIAILRSGIAAIADQMNGLLRADLRRRTVERLEPPAGTTLVGIDGLEVLPGGQLVAVQAGVRPVRVLRIDVGDTADGVGAVSVLESGHLPLSAPGLGAIATNGDFFYVGNPGWNRISGPGSEATPPRAVAVFRTGPQ